MCITQTHVQLSFIKYDLQVMFSRDQNIKIRQSNARNFCMSEANVTNLDVHHHAIDKYIITLS